MASFLGCKNSEIHKIKWKYRISDRYLSSPSTSKIISREDCLKFLNYNINPLSNYQLYMTVESFNFYKENFCVSLEAAITMCTDPLGQRSQAWKKNRSVRITASKARSLITYCKNHSPNWPLKIASYFDDTFQGCKDTTHGVRNEAFARACYEKQTGFKVFDTSMARMQPRWHNPR